MVSDLFKQKERFEKGIVRRLNGSYATVEILRKNSPECTNCSSCAGADDKPQLFEVKAFPGLKAGERVTLQTIGHSPYTGMILIFILPLVSLVIGSFLGRKWHFLYPNSSDVRMISCGFIFFSVVPCGGKYLRKNDATSETNRAENHLQRHAG